MKIVKTLLIAMFLFSVVVAFSMTSAISADGEYHVDEHGNYVYEDRFFVNREFTVEDFGTVKIPVHVQALITIDASDPTSITVDTQGQVRHVTAKLVDIVETALPISSTVVIDNIQWSLVETTDKGQTFDYMGELSDQYTDVTEARFLVTAFNVENLGMAPVELYGYVESIEIVETQGRRFTPYFLKWHWDKNCKNVSLNPGIAKTCYIVFELPLETGELQLQLTGNDATSHVLALSEISGNPPTPQPTEVLVATPTPTPTVTSIPTPVATPMPATVNEEEVLAQLADYSDEVCDSSLTSVQVDNVVEKYRQFFADREVQLTGTVKDVRESMGEYNVIVSVDNATRDIMVNKVPEEQALSLNKGDDVLIAGSLELSSCYIYVQLYGTLTVR